MRKGHEVVIGRKALASACSWSMVEYKGDQHTPQKETKGGFLPDKSVHLVVIQVLNQYNTHKGICKCQ